jgi:hypothetical protein
MSKPRDPNREIPSPVLRAWTWQRSRILLAGIAVAAVVVTFPPWDFLAVDGQAVRCIDAGRSWIFLIPKPEFEIMNGVDLRNVTPEVDLIRLGLQVASVALATVVALMLRSRFRQT